jgi:hypothetical protein
MALIPIDGPMSLNVGGPGKGVQPLTFWTQAKRLT